MKIFLLLFFVSLLVVGTYLYTRPIAAIQPSTETLSSPGATVSLPWPAYGQGALAEKSFGLLASYGSQAPVPMASTAKIVTALAITKQKPLKVGEQGPLITIKQTDVEAYNSYYLKGGSVAKVVIGEQISQYQALQAALLPSANNLADTLARWAFGSVENYVKFANQMLDEMHLSKTQVADASGFSGSSVSTAEELVKLGEALMADPVLAQIVAQENATIPVAGMVNNLNWLLGSEGVIGIKTGNTDEAGGCFLFAAKRQIIGQSMTFIGAIMGAPTRNQAISDARAILRSLDSNFEERLIAKKGQVLGRYSSPWGDSAEVTLSEEFKVLAWKGQNLSTKLDLNNASAPLPTGSQVGLINSIIGDRSDSRPLVLKDRLAAPPWHWRLFR